MVVVTPPPPPPLLFKEFFWHQPEILTPALHVVQVTSMRYDVDIDIDFIGVDLQSIPGLLIFYALWVYFMSAQVNVLVLSSSHLNCNDVTRIRYVLIPKVSSTIFEEKKSVLQRKCFVLRNNIQTVTRTLWRPKCGAWEGLMPPSVGVLLVAVCLLLKFRVKYLTNLFVSDLLNHLCTKRWAIMSFESVKHGKMTSWYMCQ